MTVKVRGRRILAALGWTASMAMLIWSSTSNEANLARWALWTQMAAFVPTVSLVMERVALKKTARYERILRDVIRISAEESVRANAEAARTHLRSVQ